MAVDHPKTLYEDEHFMITHSSRGSGHTIQLKLSSQSYELGRGLLEELAQTSRPDFGVKLEGVIEGVHQTLIDQGLTPDSLGFALAQAYIEEEERFEDYLRRQKAGSQ